MRSLLNIASVVALADLGLIWLQYVFSVQTAMVGLFVFGVACGISVAPGIMRKHGGAAHGDAHVEGA